MRDNNAKNTNLTLATYLFDGGNLQSPMFIQRRVFTIVTLLEPVSAAFPARLLPKTRPANQNLPDQQSTDSNIYFIRYNPRF